MAANIVIGYRRSNILLFHFYAGSARVYSVTSDTLHEELQEELIVQFNT